MESTPAPAIAFSRYFRIVPAFSEALKDEVYRIRHRVYCEELAFEPTRPEGRESDEYDAHSLHVLIRSVETGEFIGCTRIIRARESDPAYPFPFEKTCAGSLDRTVIDPATMPRNAVAEVSRLAVIGRFRRRKGEERSAVPLTENDFGTPAQPRFPYIPIGLYLATVEIARLNGIGTLFVLTEQRLASHFARLGVRIQVIGTPVEHRGLRVPSVMDTNDILGQLKPIFRPLYETIARDVRSVL